MNDRSRQRLDIDSDYPTLFKIKLVAQGLSIPLDMNVYVDEQFYTKYTIHEDIMFYTKVFGTKIDIYDLDIDDFVEVVAPSFYTRCSGIADSIDREKLVNIKDIFFIDRYILDFRENSAENRDRASIIRKKILSER